MAASLKVSGYQCQFVSEVSDDLLCGACKQVAREPHITDCCGEHFCKACVDQVKEAAQSCPSCDQAEFASILNKRIQRRILALQAHCTMKDRGCQWVGKLEDLEAHLGSDCQYVDIECTDKCGERVPRHQLPSHLANSCLNRDYFCQYCNFSGTYRVVRDDHWPECPHYPVTCPNGCSVGAVERGDLEDHIKVCLLQEVPCAVSPAGCGERFLRQDEDRHMERNTQKHLLLTSAKCEQLGQEFEQKLQQQRAETERVKQELQRQRSETEGVRAETERLKLELREQKAETERIKQEQTKETEGVRQELQAWIHRVRVNLKANNINL